MAGAGEGGGTPPTAPGEDVAPATAAPAAATAAPGPSAPGLDRPPAPAGPVVAAIAGQGFRVGQSLFLRGLMLTPDRAIGWTAPAWDALELADLAPLPALDPRPEFILLGTGLVLRLPRNALVRQLEDMGIGVEPMDSRAAARAWGLLRSEGRHIAAALLPLL